MSTGPGIYQEPHVSPIRLPNPLWIGLATGVLAFAAVAPEVVLPIWRQQSAIRGIEQLGGSIQYDPAGPEWVRDWWDDPDGNSPFDGVVTVDMGIAHVTDADLKLLGVFPRLKKLELNDSQITDAGLAVLARLEKLESLDLSDTRVTEAGLAQLQRMNLLEHLLLPGFKLHEQGLKELCSLPRLKEVTLGCGGEPASAEIVDIAEARGFDLFWLTDADFQKKTHQTLRGRNKIVLVYCYAPKDLKWENESVDFDLAKHVACQLNGKEIRTVDPDRVYDWLDKNDRWRKTSEIGAALKSDYVVHIDFKDYSLTEASVKNLYRGRADCIVNVVKMDENKSDGTVIYTTAIKSTFPTNGPVDQQAMTYAEFRKRYQSFLSDEIGRLFYPQNFSFMKEREVIPNEVLDE